MFRLEGASSKTSKQSQNPKEDDMRKLLSATCALAMVVPATVLTATSAEARTYYSGCKRGKNTVGLILGGAAGALLGRAVDGGRSRATGTIVGAGAGALLGREVQRGRRCR
jgi:outer membrane lipoprotein SlyB